MTAVPIDRVSELGRKTLHSRDVQPEPYGLLARILPPYDLPCPRTLLNTAADDVQGVAANDRYLQLMAAELLILRDAGKPGQTALMRDIDGLLALILKNALARQGLGWFTVRVSSCVRPGMVQAVAILSHRWREERRMIEVNLK